MPRKRQDPMYVLLSRLALGTVFFISGMSGFVDYPELKFMAPDDPRILGELMDSPLFYTLKAIEFLIGLAFLFNILIQTAIIITIPIVLMVSIFNIWFFAPIGYVSLLLFVPMIVLIYFYRQSFKVFFSSQLYANTMGESTPRIIVYDEVLEKAPDKTDEFEDIFGAIKKA